MKYALLSYKTTNLGDEIQSIAAQQFLPSTDLLVDRDAPNILPRDTKGGYRIIFNGWHTHKPENWPPSPQLDPLLVSMHITNETPSLNTSRIKPAGVLLEGANLEFLKAHAPVGARDLWTMELLREKGVDAYFSACMTLTIGPGTTRPRHDYVCGVNLPAPVLRALRQRVHGPFVQTTQEYTAPGSFADRMARARQLLSLYAQAKCVVTSKLHCALPCVALGTPVLFVIAAGDTYRFSGLRDLVRNCTPEEFLSGKVDFDPNNPPQNGNAHLPYREALIGTASRFIDPARADAGAPLHPFEPDGDVEKLLAAVSKPVHKSLMASIFCKLFGSA